MMNVYSEGQLLFRQHVFQEAVAKGATARDALYNTKAPT